VTDQESPSHSMQTVSTSGQTVDKLQRDNPTVANFEPQPGPHHSGAHRDMSRVQSVSFDRRVTVYPVDNYDRKSPCDVDYVLNEEFNRLHSF